MICEFCKQEIKTDAQYIKDLWFHNDCILRVVVENQQLKEQVEYLRRSCERKEDTIISLEQDLTIIDELEKWIKDLSTEKTNSFGDKGKCVAIWNYAILDKISELRGEENENK